MIGTYHKVKSVAKKLQTANARIDNKNLKEYNKELRRLQKAVARIEERGYEFPKLPFKELKQPKPASIERLQGIKTQDLYKYATYTTPEGTISGTERRKQERKEASAKAKATRERKKQQELEPQPESFEDKIHQQDQITIQRLKEDQDFRQAFSQGKIVYDQIMDMIYDIDISHQRSADALRRFLDEEFDKYGEDAVLQAMGNASQQMIEHAQTALDYKPEDERHLQAVTAIDTLISGEVPTMERAKYIQDIVEKDSYEN